MHRFTGFAGAEILFGAILFIVAMLIHEGWKKATGAKEPPYTTHENYEAYKMKDNLTALTIVGVLYASVVIVVLWMILS